MDKVGIEFRLIIAYLISGCVGLYAVSFHSKVVANLLGGVSNVPTGSSIILIVILAIACGIVINAVTWALVRPAIERRSLRRPELNYYKLTEQQMGAFSVILEENFRYYQPYSNLLTSLLLLQISALIGRVEFPIIVYIALAVVCFVLYFAARDSLRRSYEGMERLLKDGGEDHD